MSFERYFPPDPETLLAMRPEEVAVLLLQVLRDMRGPIEPNFAITLPEDKYAGPARQNVLLLMAEAFAYLQREGFVVPFPPELHIYRDKNRVYFMLSREGKTIELPAGFEQHQHAQLLPKELLHSSLMSTVLPLFQRRAYETAVFAAMKQVEIAVRAVSQLPENLVGTALMRKAFLADQRLGKGFVIEAERQALSDLFAGAMGYFRNSTGHRTVDFEPAEAARVILFASELLNMVDERERATA
jgi:uncharacterized protein (TIGR02391 family)